MCGIFAYLHYNFPNSRKNILQILIGGLRRLEYRGYDSVGLCIEKPYHRSFNILKVVGNVDALVPLVEKDLSQHAEDYSCQWHCSLAHTRWATHGPPTIANAHPHSSGGPNHEFVVVHNGIITNYVPLKKMLSSKGYSFESETDTEVIAKLALYIYDKSLEEGHYMSFCCVVANVLQHLEGAYAIAMKSLFFPGELVAARKGSPLIIGIKSLDDPEPVQLKTAPMEMALKEMMAKKVPAMFHLEKELASTSSRGLKKVEYFVASDIHAIIEHTGKVLFLEDEDLVHFQNGHFDIYSKTSTHRDLHTISIDLSEISKCGFSHFMHKEIHEQPESILNTTRGRINYETRKVMLGGLRDRIDSIKHCRRLMFIACGSSYHSCLAVRAFMEEMSELPVSIELASDFLDRKTPVFRDDTCFFVSQSGETADTLNALEYCISKKALCVGVTNTVGSSISRLTDCGVHLNAGAEIGVASTKAYTSQIIALIMIAIMIGEDRKSKTGRIEAVIEEISHIPTKIQTMLHREAEIITIANQIYSSSSMLVMGRGYQYATCLEASLKIKEVCYIHTEGVLAGELKHGPLALVDSIMPIIFIATKDDVFTKVKNALSQVKARSASPIILYHEGSTDFQEEESFIKISIPPTIDCLQTILNIIPLQLLAYHIALLKGHNVDQPRHLAKSVTTE